MKREDNINEDGGSLTALSSSVSMNGMLHRLCSTTEIPPLLGQKIIVHNPAPHGSWYVPESFICVTRIPDLLGLLVREATQSRITSYL